MDGQAIFIALLVIAILVLIAYTWQQRQQCQQPYGVDPRIKPVQDIMVATVLKYKQQGCEFADPEMVLMGLQMMADELCSAHVKNDVNATAANLRARMNEDMGDHESMTEPDNETDADSNGGVVSSGVGPSYMSMMPPIPDEVMNDGRGISDELINLYAQVAMNICVDGEPDMDKLTAISKQIYNNLCSEQGDNQFNLDAGMRQGVLSRAFDSTMTPLLGPHANGAGMNMRSASAANGNGTE